MYCTMHDTAFIVRGCYPYGLPPQFKNNNDDCSSISKGCDHCDWINNGIVLVDTDKVNIVEHVETNYDNKYRGGFSFHMISCIFDEIGNILEYDGHSIFGKWLNGMQKSYQK